VDDPELEVGGAAYVVAYVGADHGLVWQRTNEARSEPVLSQSDVERIGSKLAIKIEKLARSNALPIASTIDIILRVWNTFGRKNEARAWIEKNLCDPVAFAKIAFSQMGEVSSSSPPYRYRELGGRIDNELFDLRTMLRLAKKHQSSDVFDTGDREDLQRFAAALETQISPAQS
jgi:hypothetical protein